MTAEQRLERLNKVLDEIVGGFFCSGEMSFESAYALAVQAKIAVETLRGIDCPAHRLPDLHFDPKYWAITYPDDIAIEKHIDGLFELRDMLASSSALRDTLIFIGKEEDSGDAAKRDKPYLRLLPPPLD